MGQAPRVVALRWGELSLLRLGQRIQGRVQPGITCAEFEISALTHPGKNTVAVEVYRWCAGSYLEDQDMWRLAGVFRDVFVYSPPPAHIRDFSVACHLDGDYKDAVMRVWAEVRNLSQRASGPLSMTVSLIDPFENRCCGAGRPVSITQCGSSRVEMSAEVVNPRKCRGTRALHAARLAEAAPAFTQPGVTSGFGQSGS